MRKDKIVIAQGTDGNDDEYVDISYYISCKSMQ